MSWTPETIDEIVRIGQASLPREACGLVLPDGSVVELENLSPEPTERYEITGEQVWEALSAWQDSLPALQPASPGNVIVWHTHPSGHVGPSRGDMRTRLRGGSLEELTYMVVALPGGEAAVF